MVKVFFDADTFEKEFTERLKEHSKVHYSEKFDAYLIKDENYNEVSEELKFNEQIEFQTDDLIRWDCNIMNINELVSVCYEQESVSVLRKEYYYHDCTYINLDEELVDELCTSDDWGVNIDVIAKTQLSANISSDLSDIIIKLKKQGFDIVIY